MQTWQLVPESPQVYGPCMNEPEINHVASDPSVSANQLLGTGTCLADVWANDE